MSSIDMSRHLCVRTVEAGLYKGFNPTVALSAKLAILVLVVSLVGFPTTAATFAETLREMTLLLFASCWVYLLGVPPLYRRPAAGVGWSRPAARRLRMFENDYPLLSTPTLTALILQLGTAGELTADGCTEAFLALLRTAHEPLAVPREAVRERFEGHIRQFEIARLLEPVADGTWRLTQRGRAAASAHPQGLDPTDLVLYPEYAAHIRASARSHAEADPRAASYDAGYNARRQGQPFTANPHMLNTADFLSWENGWMEALDDERP